MTTNIQHQKIKNIILENAQYGLARCVDILNNNGFIAPCGKKYNWKKDQVKAILTGKTYEVEKTITIGAAITKTLKAAILKSDLSISDFIREALEVKLHEEGLL